MNSKWMMLAVAAYAFVLAGCAKNKNQGDVGTDAAPATDVAATGDFGDKGPSSANAGDGSGVNSEDLDEAARKLEGDLRPVFFWDRLYIGGGNSRRIRSEVLQVLGDDVVIVSNTAGILGGVRAWNLIS